MIQGCTERFAACLVVLGSTMLERNREPGKAWLSERRWRHLELILEVLQTPDDAPVVIVRLVQSGELAAAGLLDVLLAHLAAHMLHPSDAGF